MLCIIFIISFVSDGNAFYVPRPGPLQNESYDTTLETAVHKSLSTNIDADVVSQGTRSVGTTDAFKSQDADPSLSLVTGSGDAPGVTVSGGLEDDTKDAGINSQFMNDINCPLGYWCR